MSLAYLGVGPSVSMRVLRRGRGGPVRAGDVRTGAELRIMCLPDGSSSREPRSAGGLWKLERKERDSVLGPFPKERSPADTSTLAP